MIPTRRTYEFLSKIYTKELLNFLHNKTHFKRGFRNFQLTVSMMGDTDQSIWILEVYRHPKNKSAGRLIPTIEIWFAGTMIRFLHTAPTSNSEVFKKEKKYLHWLMAVSDEKRYWKKRKFNIIFPFFSRPIVVVKSVKYVLCHIAFMGETTENRTLFIHP